MAYINNTTASVSIGGVSIPGTQIKSITINEGISNGNNLTMGNSNSAEIEIELIKVSKATTTAMRSYAPVSVSITRTKITENDEDTIPFHRTWNYFYVTKAEVKRNGNTNFYNVKVTAMDAISKFSSKQIPQLPETTTLGNVFETLYLDIGTSGQMFRGSDIEVPYAYFGDKKYREALEIIAGLVGGYAYVNADGKLSIDFLSKGLTPAKIGAEDIYLSGVNLDASSEDQMRELDEEGNLIVTGDESEVVKISGVVCEVADAQLKAGNMTYPLVFHNKAMTPDFIKTIYSEVITKVSAYTPLALKWVGNPTYKIGSMIEVEDFDGTKYKTYIMDRTCHFDGSYYEEIFCYKPTSSASSDFESGISKEEAEEIANDAIDKKIRFLNTSYSLSVLELLPDGTYKDYLNPYNGFCTVYYFGAGAIEYVEIEIFNLPNDRAFFIPFPEAFRETGLFGGAGTSQYLTLLDSRNSTYQKKKFSPQSSVTRPTFTYTNEIDNSWMFEGGVTVCSIQYALPHSGEGSYLNNSCVLYIGNQSGSAISNKHLSLICHKHGDDDNFNSIAMDGERYNDYDNTYPYNPDDPPEDGKQIFKL